MSGVKKTEGKIPKVKCVWPATLLEEKDVRAFTKWMLDTWGVRVYDVEQLNTNDESQSIEFNRKDVFFHMHGDDAGKFAVPRLSTEIKWWADWMAGHRDDYSEDVINRLGDSW